MINKTNIFMFSLKRIACAVLMLSLILAMPVVRSADTSVYDTDDKSTARGLFEQLGIVPHYIDDSIFDKEIARADFMQYIGRMLKIDENDTDVQQYFYDVPSDHFAYGTVNNLCKMGVIKQGNGYFEPDRNITYDETLTVLVRMLGYGNIAELDGGFPNGYRKIALRLKLMPSNNTNSITLGDALTAARNAMFAPVYEPETYNSDKMTYNKGDKTLFDIYWNLKYTEGIVDAIFGTSLYADTEADENECVINGVKYLADNFDTDGYIGMSVEAIYRQEGNKDDKRIVYAYAKDNEVKEMSCEDIRSADGNYTIKYYEDNKNKSINLKPDAAVIQNGTRLDSDILLNLNPKVGTVRFIDNDGDKKYDVAIYKVPQLVKVSYKDNNLHKIYNSYDKTAISCEENEYKKVSYKILSTGSAVGFDNIDTDAVLSVYKSKDCLEIIILDNTISGVVQAFNKNDGDTVVTVSGSEYKVSPLFLKQESESSTALTVGRNTTFIIDEYGRIAGENSSLGDDMQIGFLIKKGDGNSVFDSTISFKIVASSGNVITVKTADKWSINDKNIKDGDIKGTAISKTGSDFVPQLVRYKLKSDGTLSEIKTAKSESDDNENGDLVMTNDYEEKPYSAGAKMFGQRILIGAETLCFMIPKDTDIPNSEDDDFGTVKYSFFADWNSYTIGTFKINKQSPVEQVLVCRQSNAQGVSKTSDTIMVDETGTCLNDEGSVVEYLKCLSMGAETTLNADTGFSFSAQNIKQGDLIRVGKNSRGDVNEVQLLYRYGSPSFEKVVPAADFNSNDQYWMGFAYENLGGAVKIGTSTWESYDTVGDLRSVSVMIYNPELENEKVYSGSYEDIKSYKQSGERGDRVIIRTNHGQVKCAVVYKGEQ